MTEKLKKCPCGKIPTNLIIAESGTCKWAYVSGNCCGDWELEFRTDYYDINSDECLNRAIQRWNEAERG